MVIVVMGAAGAGKSTVGVRLAAHLGYRFVDADAVHPDGNLKKMAAGVPLTDEDRAPWLSALAEAIEGYLEKEEDVVLACSALKREYREQLFRDPARMRLVYLRGSREQLEERLKRRTDHVAGPALLHSQLEILEEPAGAITVNIDATPAELVEQIARELAAAPSG